MRGPGVDCVQTGDALAARFAAARPPPATAAYGLWSQGLPSDGKWRRLSWFRFHFAVHLGGAGVDRATMPMQRDARLYLPYDSFECYCGQFSSVIQHGQPFNVGILAVEPFRSRRLERRLQMLGFLRATLLAFS
jgi:hypothetical protein